MSKLTEVNKKMEKAVVEGYKKIEDKFIATFLTKDGESVEEARERMNSEKEENE